MRTLLLPILLTIALALAGLLNLVPDLHPEGEERKAAVAPHLRRRSDWLLRHSSSELTELASIHGRTIRERYAPYLSLRRHLGADVLVAHRRSLVSADDFAAKDLGRQPDEGAPVALVEAGRTLGLGRMTVDLCEYDPRLPDRTAAALRERSLHHDEWESGHEYWIVAGRSDASSRAWLLVDGDDIFFVSEQVLAQLDRDLRAADC